MCQLKPLSTAEGSDRSNLAAVSAGCSSSVPFKPSLGRTILTGKRKHFEIASTVVAPIRVAPSAAAYTAAAFSSSSKIAYPSSTSPVSSPPRYSSEEEDGDAFDDGLGDFGQLEPAFKKQKVSEYVAVNRPKASSTSASASASSVNNNNNKVSLVQAARSGDLKVVQELLEEYKQSGQLSQIINQQVVGCTALHYAVFYNRMDIVQVLVQYGAGLNIPNESELTPLAWAVDRGHTAIVRFLLQAGADPQLPDKQGATPLHKAILSGNAEITRSLLTCAALAKSGVAAAASASASEDSESEDSDYEIDEDEDEDEDEDVCYSGYGVPKKMKKGHAVKKAQRTSSPPSAAAALPRLDVNAGTKDEGLTALHQAALHGRAELVELLVTLAGRTLDVNARTVRDATPLHKAACKNHAAVAECLLRHGARVDALDRTQRTALHWACFYGHSEVARVLLKYGASPDIEDKLHTSPLALAERKGFEEMVKLLEESKDLCATQ